jgi:hypothetical protein
MVRKRESQMLLEELAVKYGTDKQEAGHGYTKHYDDYLDSMRDTQFNLLELGVREGWSVNMWAEYLPDAEIWGIDNDAEGLCPKSFDNPRIHFRLGCQEDCEFLTAVCQEAGGFQVIIDDASHISPLTKQSFECLFPQLPVGGLYIIEDLHVCGADGYCPYGPTTLEYLDSMPAAIMSWSSVVNCASFIPQKRLWWLTARQRTKVILQRLSRMMC